MHKRDDANPWNVNSQKNSNNHRNDSKQNKNVSKKGGSAQSGKSATATINSAVKTTDQKFQDAKQKHLEYAKKHQMLHSYESSSDEEDGHVDDTVFESVFKGYDGNKAELQKTHHFLENVFQSGVATCLICIASIKRTDPIWSCEDCYSFFHLPCVQRWGNDSTSLMKMHQDAEVGYYNNQGEYVAKVKKTIKWNCPKCRKDYLRDEIPRNYTCFCKKENNPENHPWLVPHSCGEMCRKLLKPDCGHRCVLLCHPGPCPPCPQMVSATCACGQSNPRMMRCSQKIWKCLNKCRLVLKCGIHVCGLPCHDRNQCPPCIKKSKQSCLCGHSTQERNCTESIWQCNKICNKMFPCGLHRCEIKCHEGECGECALGLPRECPCGKEKTQAPCSEEIGPCGNTCQKLLTCELHICVERCHKGNCSQCLEIIKKDCRCGTHSKELPCHKTFTCETKCKQMRDCNKHACNRKCCDGQCPACDKICGKTLSCGKHKCSSLCHHGQCYPCTLKMPVKCRCGGTSINVPCGREKKTKPPKCLKPCKFQSKCHHENPHRCHQNECPTCVEQCNLPNDVTKCDHLCQSKCHDAVKISIIDKNFKPAGPWEKQIERFEIQKLPHPPCAVMVPVTCIGGHETVEFPCWNSQPSSCGRSCNRALKCGNHVCQLQCHAVDDLTSTNQQSTCSPCQEGCARPRPEGCYHPCQKPCHSKDCDVCEINVRVACHCALTQVYYKCGKYFTENSETLLAAREKMQSCGNRCIKNYACGHRCINVCHSGACLNPEACKKKVKVYCECKTRKTDVTCDKIRAGFTLNCDDNCAVKQAEQQAANEENERRQKAIEDEKNRIEMLEFEKKFGKKKYKERKRNQCEENEGTNLKLWIGIGVLLVAVLIGLYFVIFN